MKKGRIFLRSLFLSTVILFCFIFGGIGAAKAYENTLITGFGEYKKAVEYKDGVLRVFDFEIVIQNVVGN